jgi:hypothetical protein
MIDTLTNTIMNKAKLDARYSEKIEKAVMKQLKRNLEALKRYPKNEDEIKSFASKIGQTTFTNIMDELKKKNLIKGGANPNRSPLRRDIEAYGEREQSYHDRPRTNPRQRGPEKYSEEDMQLNSNIGYGSINDGNSSNEAGGYSSAFGPSTFTNWGGSGGDPSRNTMQSDAGNYFKRGQQGQTMTESRLEEFMQERSRDMGMGHQRPPSPVFSDTPEDHYRSQQRKMQRSQNGMMEDYNHMNGGMGMGIGMDKQMQAMSSGMPPGMAMMGGMNGSGGDFNSMLNNMAMNGGMDGGMGGGMKGMDIDMLMKQKLAERSAIDKETGQPGQMNSGYNTMSNSNFNMHNNGYNSMMNKSIQNNSMQNNSMMNNSMMNNSMMNNPMMNNQMMNNPMMNNPMMNNPMMNIPMMNIPMIPQMDMQPNVMTNNNFINYDKKVVTTETKKPLTVPINANVTKDEKYNGEKLEKVSNELNTIMTQLEIIKDEKVVEYLNQRKNELVIYIKECKEFMVNSKKDLVDKQKKLESEIIDTKDEHCTYVSLSIDPDKINYQLFGINCNLGKIKPISSINLMEYYLPRNEDNVSKGNNQCCFKFENKTFEKSIPTGIYTIDSLIDVLKFNFPQLEFNIEDNLVEIRSAYEQSFIPQFSFNSILFTLGFDQNQKYKMDVSHRASKPITLDSDNILFKINSISMDEIKLQLNEEISSNTLLKEFRVPSTNLRKLTLIFNKSDGSFYHFKEPARMKFKLNHEI